MSDQANMGIKSIEVEAVVTRADGSVEDQGIVAQWYSEEPNRNKGFIEFIKELTNGTTSS